MSKVRGDNVVVTFFDGGFYKPYACALNCSLEITSDIIETSVSGSGNWANWEYSRDSWSGSCDGIVSLQETNTLDLAELQAKQIAHTKLLMHYTRTSDTGEVYESVGYVLITGSSDTGNFGGMNTFSITFRGTGALAQSFVPSPINPPGTMHSLFINLTGAQTGATSYTMATDKIIIGAFRLVDYIIITTGTPNVNEIKYVAATGVLSWLVELGPDEFIHIQYQDV
jgi:hypothetical protein